MTLEREKGNGQKKDKDKDRWDLLPWKPVREVVKVLTFGAQKYDDNNWQKVPKARDRYMAATHRHVYAWFNGESHDPESGLHHLAHAVCCLLFLMWFEMQPTVARMQPEPLDMFKPGAFDSGITITNEPNIIGSASNGVLPEYLDKDKPKDAHISLCECDICIAQRMREKRDKACTDCSYYESGTCNYLGKHTCHNEYLYNGDDNEIYRNLPKRQGV